MSDQDPSLTMGPQAAPNPGPAEPGPASAAGAGEWQKADLGGLRDRLAEVKSLLEQALAVGLAQDLERLEALAELEARSREGGHGDAGRRRYR